MVVVDYLGPEVGHQEEVSTNSHTVQETPKVDRGAILGGGVGNNTTGLVWSGLIWSGLNLSSGEEEKEGVRGVFS